MNTGENTYFMNEKDESELARLIWQDALYNAQLPLLPKEFHVEDGSILDLACGPGGWAIQVGLRFPDSSITGVDISSQMITYARAQARVRKLKTQFRIMDILQLPWEDVLDQSFDLVNARFIATLVPARRLSELCTECWRVLRDGGLFRYTEGIILSSPTAPSTRKVSSLAMAATYASGLSFSPQDMGTAPVLCQILKQIGFSHPVLTPYAIDVSAGAPMHQAMKENWYMSIGLLKPFLLRMKVASEEEIDRLQEDFAHEWDEPNFCGYYYLCSVTATKL